MNLLNQHPLNQVIRPIEKRISKDGSIKYLWGLADGKTVESIYFTFYNQPYICISSQIGCNVGCSFCETGKQRSERNLSPEEIYGQVAVTIQDLGISYLYQIAFAGMGEALHNYENVIQGAQLIRDDHLAESISVSSAGYVPKIKMLAGEKVVDQLFISLHATTNEVRNHLVPMNRRYPIPVLLEAAEAFYRAKNKPVTVSYLMLGGINDSDDDLERLVALLNPEAFIVQLMEWNPVSDIDYIRSTRVDYFEQELNRCGQPVFISRSKGIDIEGGCGQLRSRHLEELNSSGVLNLVQEPSACSVNH